MDLWPQVKEVTSTATQTMFKVLDAQNSISWKQTDLLCTPLLTPVKDLTKVVTTMPATKLVNAFWIFQQINSAKEHSLTQRSHSS